MAASSVSFGRAFLRHYLTHSVVKLIFWKSVFLHSYLFWYRSLCGLFWHFSSYFFCHSSFLHCFDLVFLKWQMVQFLCSLCNRRQFFPDFHMMHLGYSLAATFRSSKVLIFFHNMKPRLGFRWFGRFAFSFQNLSFAEFLNCKVCLAVY